MADEESISLGELLDELDGGDRTTPVWFLDSRGTPRPINSVTFEGAADFELGDGTVVILEHLRES